MQETQVIRMSDNESEAAAEEEFGDEHSFVSQGDYGYDDDDDDDDDIEIEHVLKLSELLLDLKSVHPGGASSPAKGVKLRALVRLLQDVPQLLLQVMGPFYPHPLNTLIADIGISIELLIDILYINPSMVLSEEQCVIDDVYGTPLHAACASKDEPMIQFLASTFPHLASIPNDNGDFPLHMALAPSEQRQSASAEGGYSYCHSVDTIRLLSQQDRYALYKENSSHCLRPLELACQFSSNQVIQFFFCDNMSQYAGSQRK
jgi:hypothetical protein